MPTKINSEIYTLDEYKKLLTYLKSIPNEINTHGEIDSKYQIDFTIEIPFGISVIRNKYDTGSDNNEYRKIYISLEKFLIN